MNDTVRVVVPIAEGVEEVEALTVVDILRRAGAIVVIAAVGPYRNVISSHRVSIIADVLFREVNDSSMDAIVLPGGMPGTTNLLQDAKVKDCVIDLYKMKRTVAAICAAPWVLAECGVIEGKHVTCYPEHKDKLRGAIYVEEPVVQEDNVITASGMGTAIPFALKLVEQLFSKEKANEIAKTILADECTF